MRNTLAIVCILSAALNGATSSGEQPTDTLSAQVDKLVNEKLTETWLGHNYSDRRVQELRKRLSHISFPAPNDTVAGALGISDPLFFVGIRECGFSLVSEVESGSTRTHEFCKLNGDFELVVIRRTVYFRDHRNPETMELSAEIRRIAKRK